MRGSLIFVLVILCGYFAYLDYRNRERIQALEQRCHELERQLDESKGRRSPVPLVRVICPSCNGEGRLMARRQDGRDWPYVCPVCQGEGRRDVEVPPGYKLCPDCQGMTRVALRTGRRPLRISATRCLRCNYTGAVKASVD